MVHNTTTGPSIVKNDTVFQLDIRNTTILPGAFNVLQSSFLPALKHLVLTQFELADENTLIIDLPNYALDSSFTWNNYRSENVKKALSRISYTSAGEKEKILELLIKMVLMSTKKKDFIFMKTLDEQKKLVQLHCLQINTITISLYGYFKNTFLVHLATA
jgi:hypothetical protein